MRFPGLIPVLWLAACGQEAPPPALPAASTDGSSASSVSLAAGPALATVDSTGLSAVESTSTGSWDALTRALGGGDPEADKAMADLIKRRSVLVKMEDQRISASMLDLETDLATRCDVKNTAASFSEHQARESSSLAADRTLVVELLRTAGEAGRTRAWSSSNIGALVTGPRDSAIEGGFQAMPGWMAQVSDTAGQVDAQRRLLAMNLSNESAVMESRAVISATAAQISAVDPAPDTAPDTVGRLLAEADKVVLAQQARSFQKLVGVCTTVPEDQWLMLISGHYVSAYIGLLGGEAETPSSGSSNSSSGFGSGMGGGQMGGQMGGSQMGGGQMGGGQMGGGQMGGGQMGGGQMGGSQSGGNQSGGSQMGGGQMGGGQMGGNQSGGGQMGGGQSGGGQMGGGQMGGGQMGGGQMGGGSQGSQGNSGKSGGGSPNNQGSRP